MKIEMKHAAWNVRNENELRPVAARLAEYGIPFVLGRPESGNVPGHAPILVSGRHLPKAIHVIERDFGRRSGVDLL